MSCSLDRLGLYRRARISGVACPDGSTAHERVQQLADIGFVAGAPVTVLARAWPGGDPLVVRVGESRFALRRAEAACVQVDPVAEAA